jgi:hypothetical protein
MILLLLAAVSMSSPSPVDAERAYAAMAQEKGQWTAFRTTAAPGAVMFAPDPVDAAAFLKGRTDPSVSVNWQPAQSYLSCDGKTAANIGPWQGRQHVGYFTTIWSRMGGSWRWDIDFGDVLASAIAAPAKVSVRRASCRAAKPALLPRLAAADKSGRGSSADHSLEWTWRVEKRGTRHLLVYLWNGRSYDTVIDRVAAGD